MLEGTGNRPFIAPYETKKSLLLPQETKKVCWRLPRKRALAPAAICASCLNRSAISRRISIGGTGGSAGVQEAKRRKS